LDAPDFLLKVANGEILSDEGDNMRNFLIELIAEVISLQRIPPDELRSSGVLECLLAFAKQFHKIAYEVALAQAEYEAGQFATGEPS